MGETLSLQRGDKVDHYVVQERVGGSATAQVYKAHDPLLNRSVAIKQVMLRDVADPEAATQAVRREAQVHRRAGEADPALLVQFIDVVDHKNGLMLISEYVDGQSLEQLLQRTGTPLDQRQALGILAAAAKALAALHGQGLLHRDLKPSNILLPQGGGLKITDFGLAAAIAEQEAMDLGSTRYMAPELLRGEKGDARSDLYSLGMVAYEMLAGRNAFEDAFRSITRDERNASMRWVKWHTNPRSKAQPLSKLNPQVPATLEQLVERLMEKDPGRRIRSANDVLEAIRRHLLNPGSASGTQSPSETPQEAPLPPPAPSVAAPAAPEYVTPTRRSKLPWILGGTLALWIAGAAGFMLYTNHRAAEQRDAKVAQAEQSLDEAFAFLESKDYPQAAAAFTDLTERFADNTTWKARAQAAQSLAAGWVLFDNSQFRETVEAIPTIEKSINDLDNESPQADEDRSAMLTSLNLLKRRVNPQMAWLNRMSDIDTLIAGRTLASLGQADDELNAVAPSLPERPLSQQTQWQQRKVLVETTRNAVLTDQVLAAARKDIENNEIPAAIRKLREAAVSRPSSSDQEQALLAELEKGQTQTAALETARRLEREAQPTDANYIDKLSAALDAWREVLKLTGDTQYQPRIDAIQAEIAYQVGLKLQEQNQVAEAKIKFEEAVAINGYEPAQVQLRTIDTRLARQASLDQANELIASGKFDRALTLLAKVPDQDALIARVRGLKAIQQGVTLLAAGNLDDAERFLLEGQAAVPEDGRPARLLERIGLLRDFAAALAEGDAALAARRWGEAKTAYIRARDMSLPVELTEQARAKLVTAHYEDWMFDAREALKAGRVAQARANAIQAQKYRNTDEVKAFLRDLPAG